MTFLRNRSVEKMEWTSQNWKSSCNDYDHLRVILRAFGYHIRSRPSDLWDPIPFEIMVWGVSNSLTAFSPKILKSKWDYKHYTLNINSFPGNGTFSSLYSPTRLWEAPRHNRCLVYLWIHSTVRGTWLEFNYSVKWGLDNIWRYWHTFS